MAKGKKLKDWEKDKLRDQTFFYNPSVKDAYDVSNQVEASFTDILTALSNGARNEEHFVTRVAALSTALLTTSHFINEQEANEAAKNVYDSMREDLKLI